MTKVVTDLKQYGTVQRALLGIAGRDMGNEVYPDEIRKEQKELGATEGVQVVEVTEVVLPMDSCRKTMSS